MRFEITIDDQNVRGAYIGKTARTFREQFGKDLQLTVGEKADDFWRTYLETQTELAKDNIEVNEDIFAGITIKAVGPETLERLVWSCLFAEDQTTPLYNQWLDEIEDYPGLLRAGVMVFNLMIGNVPIVEPEQKEQTENKKK